MKGSAEMFQRFAASGSEAVARIRATRPVSRTNPISGVARRRGSLARPSTAMPTAIRGGATTSV